MPMDKSPMTREQAGRIMFLLAGMVANEIKSGKRNLEESASTAQISPEDLANYIRMAGGEVTPDCVHHNNPCPLCIIGTVRFQDKVRTSTEPEIWTTLFKCTVCQEKFEREST